MTERPSVDVILKRAEQFAAWCYLQGQAERSVANIEAIGGDATDQCDAFVRASEGAKAARSLLSDALMAALETK